MMMDENVKKFLEEYSKKAEEDMHMFFEQMKKESLNQHEVKLSKSRYYTLENGEIIRFILPLKYWDIFLLNISYVDKDSICRTIDLREEE